MDLAIQVVSNNYLLTEERKQDQDKTTMKLHSLEAKLKGGNEIIAMIFSIERAFNVIGDHKFRLTTKNNQIKIPIENLMFGRSWSTTIWKYRWSQKSWIPDEKNKNAK